MNSPADAKEPTSQAFPAPGSAVPGAPPPLKRLLTPADGVAVGPRRAPGDAKEVAVSGRASGSRLTAAAAMVGVAVGLELAGMLAANRRRRRRHSPGS